jgi:hypothetical protein
LYIFCAGIGEGFTGALVYNKRIWEADKQHYNPHRRYILLAAAIIYLNQLSPFSNLSKKFVKDVPIII